mmetsp:Transcript_35630/g.115511  ORF Transcript_35630/g.115511 Transcript_35630/m.115511 type:complete len:203 (-) Transcript_35630:741-1349(-)
MHRWWEWIRTRKRSHCPGSSTWRRCPAQGVTRKAQCLRWHPRRAPSTRRGRRGRASRPPRQGLAREPRRTRWRWSGRASFASRAPEAWRPRAATAVGEAVPRRRRHRGPPRPRSPCPSGSVSLPSAREVQSASALGWASACLRAVRAAAAAAAAPRETQQPEVVRVRIATASSSTSRTSASVLGVSGPSVPCWRRTGCAAER